MPFTEKQKRLFQAKAHGWKPKSGVGPGKGTAKKLLTHEKKKK